MHYPGRKALLTVDYEGLRPIVLELLRVPILELRKTLPAAKKHLALRAAIPNGVGAVASCNLSLSLAHKASSLLLRSSRHLIHPVVLGEGQLLALLSVSNSSSRWASWGCCALPRRAHPSPCTACHPHRRTIPDLADRGT